MKFARMSASFLYFSFRERLVVIPNAWWLFREANLIPHGAISAAVLLRPASDAASIRRRRSRLGRCR